MNKPLELGLFCDPISKQLKGFLRKQDAKLLDADNSALNRIIVGGYLSGKAADSARKKLAKKCQTAVLRCLKEQAGVK